MTDTLERDWGIEDTVLIVGTSLPVLVQKPHLVWHRHDGVIVIVEHDRTAWAIVGAVTAAKICTGV